MVDFRTQDPQPARLTIKAEQFLRYFAFGQPNQRPFYIPLASIPLAMLGFHVTLTAAMLVACSVFAAPVEAKGGLVRRFRCTRYYAEDFL
jgi:hypothetical protein